MYKYQRSLIVSKNFNQWILLPECFSYKGDYPHVKVYRWLCFEYTCAKDKI